MLNYVKVSFRDKNQLLDMTRQDEKIVLVGRKLSNVLSMVEEYLHVFNIRRIREGNTDSDGDIIKPETTYLLIRIGVSEELLTCINEDIEPVHLANMVLVNIGTKRVKALSCLELLSMNEEFTMAVGHSSIMTHYFWTNTTLALDHIQKEIDFIAGKSLDDKLLEYGKHICKEVSGPECLISELLEGTWLNEEIIIDYYSNGGAMSKLGRYARAVWGDRLENAMVSLDLATLPVSVVLYKATQTRSIASTLEGSRERIALSRIWAKLDHKVERMGMNRLRKAQMIGDIILLTRRPFENQAEWARLMTVLNLNLDYETVTSEDVAQLADLVNPMQD